MDLNLLKFHTPFPIPQSPMYVVPVCNNCFHNVILRSVPDQIDYQSYMASVCNINIAAIVIVNFVFIIVVSFLTIASTQLLLHASAIFCQLHC